MKIENCTAIITGGASGMGAATATLFAQRGAKVAILDQNAEATEFAAKIGAEAYICDVRDESNVAKAIDAIQQFGPLRIVVNCAGIVFGRRLVQKDGPMPLEDFRKIIEINLLGTFNVMRLAADTMAKAPLLGEERGVIINTASIAAFDGQIGQCAYSASKAGIVGLTLPAARDLASLAIRVTTIAPGLVDTPMFNNMTPELKANLAAAVPHPKRLAKPEEFADLALHIVENPMLNGEVIRLDGALRMQPK